MIGDKKYILVLSWWGSKWFYHLWIIKALEESWLDSQIEAIFGVSAWAMVASYWASWLNADEIYSKLLQNIEFLSAKNLKLPPVTSILQEKNVQRMYKKHLPSTFSKLKKKLYIWATDLNTGKYKIFHTWELIPALMGSIALPVIFPPVKFWDYLLADGWIIDNFPVIRAKKIYPNHEVIGVTVSSYKKHQKVTNLLSSAMVSWNLVLSKDVEWNIIATDHLFCKNTWVSTTETNKEKLKNIYEVGYKDWMKYFKKLKK
jgi:NTE family protein